MNNNLIKCALFIFVPAFFLTGCANAQSKPNKESVTNELPTEKADLSNDEAVLAALQKIIDAKSEELTKNNKKLDTKRQAASRLEPKDVCIRRLEESKKIIIIGFFRTDAGCHLDGAFIDSRYLEREKFDLSKNVLSALGWEKASQKERENLVKIWVEKGLLIFNPMPNQTLAATTGGDGEIKVAASSTYPPGVTSRAVAKKFVFDKDGGLISAGDQ